MDGTTDAREGVNVVIAVAVAVPVCVIALVVVVACVMRRRWSEYSHYVLYATKAVFRLCLECGRVA